MLFLKLCMSNESIVHCGKNNHCSRSFLMLSAGVTTPHLLQLSLVSNPSILLVNLRLVPVVTPMCLKVCFLLQSLLPLPSISLSKLFIVNIIACSLLNCLKLFVPGRPAFILIPVMLGGQCCNGSVFSSRKTNLSFFQALRKFTLCPSPQEKFFLVYIKHFSSLCLL